MAELKPCPFCGKEAKTMNLIGDLFIVGCDYNPNCPGHIGKQAPAYYTEELAIRYWNRRAGEQEAKNVDAFVQWCIDNHIMGDATIRGIKYWAGKFKEER